MSPTTDDEVMDRVLDMVRNRHFGKYRGTVVDNEDPEQRGRLEVEVPAVLGNQAVWAIPCVPYAGDDQGFYSLPPTDAGVWVEFEGGDPSYPIWTGCFWEPGQLPDESDPAIKVWKTGSLTIRIDDNADEIRIETSGGSTLTISSDIKNESGGATLTIGSTGVVSEKGSTKSEVTDVSFKVNNGALEVM